MDADKTATIYRAYGDIKDIDSRLELVLTMIKKPAEDKENEE